MMMPPPCPLVHTKYFFLESLWIRVLLLILGSLSTCQGHKEMLETYADSQEGNVLDDEEICHRHPHA